jgi:hypothetical protein
MKHLWSLNTDPKASKFICLFRLLMKHLWHLISETKASKFTRLTFDKLLMKHLWPLISDPMANFSYV